MSKNIPIGMVAAKKCGLWGIRQHKENKWKKWMDLVLFPDTIPHACYENNKRFAGGKVSGNR